MKRLWLKPLGLVLLIGGLSSGCNYYMNHNNVRKGNGELKMTKVDFPFSRTVYSIEKDGRTSVDLGIFSDSITDSDGDGVADWVYISRGLFQRNGLYGTFHRKEDYETNKEIFENADKELARQKERFADLLNESQKRS